MTLFTNLKSQINPYKYVLYIFQIEFYIQKLINEHIIKFMCDLTIIELKFLYEFNLWTKLKKNMYINKVFFFFPK